MNLIEGQQCALYVKIDRRPLCRQEQSADQFIHELIVVRAKDKARSRSLKQVRGGPGFARNSHRVSAHGQGIDGCCKRRRRAAKVPVFASREHLPRDAVDSAARCLEREIPARSITPRVEAIASCERNS